MTIIFLEPGTDATGDLSFYSGVSGTVASDASVSNTGLRSIKCTQNSFFYVNGVLADAGRRISFFFRTSTLPAVYIVPLQMYTAGLAAVVYQLLLLSTGTLISRPIGATDANGTKVLAANTWYRITVSYTITNSTTFKFNVYVNGVLDSTATAGTLTNTASSVPSLGASSDGAVNTWHDDIYVDDVADYSDTGDVRVTAKRPVANNVNSFDTAIGASPANRWTNVNEVPISLTNGWRHNAISDVQENYTLEAPQVGDVNLAGMMLLGRAAWIWAKGAAGGVGTPGIVDNGAVTAIVLTAAAALYTVISTSPVYPSNAAGIGMRSANNADDTFLYECGTLIAYLPFFPSRPRGAVYAPLLAQ